MRSRLDQMQQLVNVRRPVRQDFLRCLGGRESNNVLGSVDLGVHATVADHACNLGLQLSRFQLQELRQSGTMDPPVIERHDSNVVLDDTAVKALVPVLG